MRDLPSGTLTFLFTDIEGSTRLWEQHPEQMNARLARHDSLLRTAIEQNDGHVFKTGGDSFCAVFSSPSQAVQAALAAQQQLAGEDAQGGLPLRARMALHTGQAQQRGDDYFGPVVNRVARMLAAGRGGRTLLSQETFAALGPDLHDGLSVRDLGLNRLKDLSTPVRIYELCHPSLPEDLSPLRSLEAFAHNLPVQMTSFIGRQAEMTQVHSLLKAARLVTLTGSGGCGKTRLALQAAAEEMDDYDDGAFLVELVSVSDPARIAPTVADALGIKEETGRALRDTLTDALRSKRLLLILDNCEHLVDGCARLCYGLLTGCPRLSILATSREALGIAGEAVLTVPSLSVPEPPGLTASPRHATLPEQIAEYDGIHLFITRAEAAAPAFRFNAANAAAVVQLCHRLDGIPLALELAAARVKSLSPQQIAQRLSDRFELLTEDIPEALPRQQTLRETINWSYDLLTYGEQTLLRRLSVFTGGWTLESAEAVCAGNGIAEADVLDLLSRLTDKSLVSVAEQNGEWRYRLLETIREYVAERLAEIGQQETLRQQHLEYFQQLGVAAEPQLTGPEQAEWLARLETEHGNLLAALAWCGESRDRLEAGLTLTGSIWMFWYTGGHWSQGRAVLEKLLNAPGVNAPEARAKALNAAGLLASCQGDYAAAEARHEEALALRRQRGDERGIAGSLGNLGSTALSRGDYATARARYEESLAICRRLGYAHGVAAALNNLGIIAHETGDYQSAYRYHTEGLVAARSQNHGWGIAGSLNNLGNAAYALEKYAEARAFYEECLEISRSVSQPKTAGDALNNLSLTLMRLGDLPEAQRLVREGLTIRRQIGDRLGLAQTLGAAGQIALAAGEATRAAHLYGAMEALRETLGSPMPPDERPAYDETVAAICRSLGPGRFAAAWAAGQVLTEAQAADYALTEGE